jgi:N-acylneuraminate cytidylyltransferase
VIGVSAVESHPLWCFTVDGSTMRPFINAAGAQRRSQELPPVFVPNGALYLSTPRDLRKHESFYIDGMVPLVIDDPRESMDIDTEWHWKLAEAVLLMREGVAR